MMMSRIHAVRIFVARATVVVLAAIVIGVPAGTASGQDFSRLTGVWQGTEVTPLGQSAVEAIFFPNGTYSRAHYFGSLMTRDSGRYEIVRNWVHFYLQSWAPTEYLGRPMTWPTSDTWIVTRFDGRILETANIRLTRVQ